MSDTPAFSVLVVDDDKAMRSSLITLLEAAGWQATAVSRATQVQGELTRMRPDVILSDVRMPGMTGLELLASLAGSDAPPLVLISAHGDIPMAVQSLQGGAYSFVEKPYDPRGLLDILDRAASHGRVVQANARLRHRLFQLSGLDRILLGQTAAITALRRDILDLADAAMPILITGETGTGKDLVARALHDLGGTPDAPFLALNCAALSTETFEAEMFGVQGQSQGRFQAAQGGSLFLDEICTCPPEVQAKLLRVIEDKQVLPVGAAEPVPVNVRILSATNEDIDKAIRTQHLRADLYYRLNTVTLTLPPLRQRREDLLLLTAHFLQEFADLYNIQPPAITAEDSAALLAHDWPGNVRELRNSCERRVLAARRGGGGFAAALHPEAELAEVPATLREAVAAFERELIAKAIRAHQGRMDETADALGIGRRTLNEKIVKLGLDKEALL